MFPSATACLSLAVAGCAAPLPPAAPPPAPSPPVAAPPPAPSAAPAPPVAADDGFTRFGGVRYRLPAGWKYTAEKEMALARSPSGDAGFLIATVDDPARALESLHRADKEFGGRFPVGMGKAANLNRLALSLTTADVDAPDGGMHLSVMIGKGPKSALLYLYVFVKVKPGAPQKNEEITAWATSVDVDAP
jgi:hypothetical protein